MIRPTGRSCGVALALLVVLAGCAGAGSDPICESLQDLIDLTGPASDALLDVVDAGDLATETPGLEDDIAFLEATAQAANLPAIRAFEKGYEVAADTAGGELGQHISVLGEVSLQFWYDLEVVASEAADAEDFFVRIDAHLMSAEVLEAGARGMAAQEAINGFTVPECGFSISDF